MISVRPVYEAIPSGEAKACGGWSEASRGGRSEPDMPQAKCRSGKTAVGVAAGFHGYKAEDGGGGFHG